MDSFPHLLQDDSDDDPPKGEGENNNAEENIYRSTGFIIWYCVLAVGIFLGPVLCCFIQYRRVARNQEQEQDASGDVPDILTDSQRAQRRAEDELAISRVEANVRRFSRNEDRRRKRALQRALRKQTVVLTPHHFYCGDEDDVFQDVSTDTRTTDVEGDDSNYPPPHITAGQLSQGCSICLGRFKPDDVVTRSSVSTSGSSSCEHVFHRDCIVTWLSTRTAPMCPVCQQLFCHEQLPLDLSYGSNASSLGSSSDTLVDDAPPSPRPVIRAVEEEEGDGSRIDEAPSERPGEIPPLDLEQ